MDSVFSKSFPNLPEVADSSGQARYDRKLLLFDRFWFLKDVAVVNGLPGFGAGSGVRH